MTRQRLPNRRAHEVLDLEWAGLRWTIGIGRDRHGEIVEVFVSDLNKSAPAFEAILRDATIVLSIALQCGASLRVIRSAITRSSDGAPASALGAILEALEAA